MARPARVTPDRILAAAAFEFAAHGFAGARVDRIARRARVNKAMLYYYFRSKQALYHTLLRAVFTRAAERIEAIASGGGAAPDKIDRVVSTFAEFIRDHEFFPAIMLREVAEGGAHLDRQTLRALVSVPRAFFAILQEGAADGALRPVNPLVAYFAVLAPIVFYLAAGPIRREVTARRLMNLGALSADDFVRQLQDAVRRAFAQDVSARTRP